MKKFKDMKTQDDGSYKKWKSLVNMSGKSIQSFLDSQDGKKAGLSRKEASTAGSSGGKISSGRDSARAIIRMKSKPYSQWDDNDKKWMKKQISFISRMKGNSGSLRDEKGRPTRKLLALKVWGHNPINEDCKLKGLAKNKSISDIANKHGVSSSEIVSQLKMGVKVEKEHTKDRKTAFAIAKDHLWEKPNYYTKLKEVEESIANMPKKLKAGILAAGIGIAGVGLKNGTFTKNFKPQEKIKISVGKSPDDRKNVSTKP